MIVPANQIDWNACRIETIRYGRTDLPVNIKVIQADFLDASVVKHAIEECSGTVQIVQIDVPFVESGKNAARKFPVMFPDNLQIIDMHTADIFLDDCFGGLEDESGLCWKDLSDRHRQMVTSLRPPQYKINGIHFWTKSASCMPRFNFHAHQLAADPYEPQLYLTAPFSDVSTIFLNSAEIDDPVNTRTGFPLRLKTGKPVMWQSEAWSHLLFTAGAQPQGDAWHTFPVTNISRLTETIGFSEVYL